MIDATVRLIPEVIVRSYQDDSFFLRVFKLSIITRPYDYRAWSCQDVIVYHEKIRQ